MLITIIQITLVFLYSFIGLITAGVSCWLFRYHPDRVPDYIIGLVLAWPLAWSVGLVMAINILLKKYLGEPPV